MLNNISCSEMVFQNVCYIFYPYYVAKVIKLIDLIVTVKYIYPLLYIQNINLSSPTPLQPYFAAFFYSIFSLPFIFPSVIIRIHLFFLILWFSDQVCFFRFSYNPFFLSFLSYLLTFQFPIISTSQNILPIFHIASVPLIPVHAWRMSVFHYLIFKPLFQCYSL